MKNPYMKDYGVYLNVKSLYSCQKDFENLKDTYNQTKESSNVELCQSLLDDRNSRYFRIIDRLVSKNMPRL